MKRRSFLGALAASPVAAPAAIGEAMMSAQKGLYGSIAQVSPDPEYTRKRLADLQEVLANADQVNSIFPPVLDNDDDLTALRSMSPAVKKSVRVARALKRNEDNFRERVQDQINDMLGLPASTRRLLGRFL